MAFFLGSVPASAQDFGQWSWDALVGLGGRSQNNVREGSEGTRWDERNMELLLGLNGFIIHPAITRFRLGLELQYINTDTGQSLDTDRLGFNGDFQFLPRGPYRGSLYFGRNRYDYSGGLTDSPFILFSAPDTVTRYGGRFRAGQGFLKGTLLGVDRSAVDFVGSDTDQQVWNQEFFDWGRSTADFSHHFRLSHRFQDQGRADLKQDELRVNLDERGDFSPTWHWVLNGSGVRQDIETFGTIQRRVDNYQVRSRLRHDVRDRDRLEFSYEFDLYRPDTRSSTESHSLSTTYQWRFADYWYAGPFVAYGRVSSDLERIQAPRAGLQLGWDWSQEAWNSSFIARGAYGVVDREVANVSQDENEVGGSFIGTLGHGNMKDLRKELEVELVRNRLRITQSVPTLPPGVALPFPGLGTEDVRRARIMLGHEWDSQSLNLWGDWNQRKANPLSVDRDTQAETLTAAVHYRAGRFGLKANIADTDLEAETRPNQSVRTVGVGVGLQTWRSVSLRASYRLDSRMIALAPNVDGTQWEAGVTWQIGQFYLDATLLETDRSLGNGPDTTRRTFIWTISRRFAGWLPIVSGPRRRGIIR